jgi:Na+/phosphate symporter
MTELSKKIRILLIACHLLCLLICSVAMFYFAYATQDHDRRLLLIFFGIIGLVTGYIGMRAAQSNWKASAEI